MFTLLRATVLVCALLLGAISTVYAQCEPGEPAYQIDLPVSAGPFVDFPTDITLIIINVDTEEFVVGETCPDYEGGNFEFCLVPVYFENLVQA